MLSESEILFICALEKIMKPLIRVFLWLEHWNSEFFYLFKDYSEENEILINGKVPRTELWPWLYIAFIIIYMSVRLFSAAFSQIILFA